MRPKADTNGQKRELLERLIANVQLTRANRRTTADTARLTLELEDQFEKMLASIPTTQAPDGEPLAGQPEAAATQKAA